MIAPGKPMNQTLHSLHPGCEGIPQSLGILGSSLDAQVASLFSFLTAKDYFGTNNALLRLS